MAPDANLGIIYQALIHSNCLTFAGPEADLEIVSQLTPQRIWKVHVLRLEGGKRSAILSEAAPSLAGAFELLHEKSALAVDEYVRNNGFDLPPEVITRSSSSASRLKKRHRRRQQQHQSSTDKDNDVEEYHQDIEQSEIISVCGVCSSSSGGSSSASESDYSDDSLDGQCSTWKRKTQSKTVVSLPPRLPKTSSRGADRERESRLGQGLVKSGPPTLPPPPPPPPPPPAGLLYSVPPPPPGWKPPPLEPLTLRGGSLGSSGADIERRSRRSRAVAPLIPRPPPPPPHHQPMGERPGRQEVVAACLDITWINVGWKKVIVQCLPVETDIVAKGLDEVRLAPQSFNACRSNRSGVIVPPPGGVTATLKQVALGSDMYELRNFGVDLSALFVSGKDIPRFEIEVRSEMPR